MPTAKEALPTAARSRSSLVRINDASTRMLEFLAVMTGEKKSTILYRLLRDEIGRHQEATAWSPAPPPFVIKPTYIETGCAVLLWNPHLPSSILTGAEAIALADALTDAVEGQNIATFELRPTRGGEAIQLSRAGRHVALRIGDTGWPMTFEVARDVAAALDSASVHADSDAVAATVH